MQCADRIHVAGRRFYGVMVSTLDSESSDPSSNLGGTYYFSFSQVQTATLNVVLPARSQVQYLAVIAQLGER